MTHYLTSASALALGLAAPAALAQGIALDLGEISVTATAEPLEERRTGTSVVIVDEEDLSVPGDLQLTDALRREAGVSVIQNGPPGTSADLRIRGAGEGFSAVYIDGIKVNDPTSTDGQYGNFGAFGIGSLAGVEVLKGSQSALYGGSAVAGVINVFTLPDLNGPEGIRQQAQLMFGTDSTVAASYSYANITGNWGVAFGLNYIDTDGFSAGDENNGNTEDDGFDETRVSFGVAYQATDILRVGFNGFYSTADSEFDEFASAPIDGTPGDETGEREEIGLRLFAELETGAWSHDFALSYFNVDRRLASVTVAPETIAAFGSPFDSQFEGERRRFEWQTSGQINSMVRLSFGADYEEEESTSSAIPGGSAEIDTTGIFAEVLYSPTQQLDITATLRNDDNSLFGSEATGRLAASYRATDRLTLRGAAATGFRPPSLSELFEDFSAFFFIGNPTLQPETSESIEIGFDYQFAANSIVSATLFRNEVDDLIQAVDCATIAFTCPAFFFTLTNVPGTSTIEGAELELQHAFSDSVNLTFAYTYLDARSAAGARLDNTPEHELFLGLDVAWTDRFTTQLAAIHQANIAPDGGIELGDFTVVDLNMTYDITDTAQAFFAVKNLFDEEYQTVANFGTSDRAFFAGIRATF